jgi:hypothetical protein
MERTVMDVRERLIAIADDEDLLEVGRKAVEDELVEWRDSGRSAPRRRAQIRNNGLVIKEWDGSDSHIIRLGPEDALRIGLKAIAEALGAEAAQ